MDERMPATFGDASLDFYDREESQEERIRSETWLLSRPRCKVPGHIPDRTHDSGDAVLVMRQHPELWPSLTCVPASELPARAFTVKDPGSGLSRPATLSETLPHIIAELPETMQYLSELGTFGNEDDVVSAAGVATYYPLLKFAKRLMKPATGFVLERHSGLASQAMQEAVTERDEDAVFAHDRQATLDDIAEAPETDPLTCEEDKVTKEVTKADVADVRIDHAFVLKHRYGADISAPSEWLRPTQLSIDSLPDEWREKAKCNLLGIEFKKLNTNITHPRARAKEWSLKPFGYGKKGMRPVGRKASVLYCQAIVYTRRYWHDTVMVDNWSAPKALRFKYPHEKSNLSTSDRNFQYPLSATLSHLGVAGAPQADDVSPQAAALFLLADNLSLVGACKLSPDVTLPASTTLLRAPSSTLPQIRSGSYRNSDAASIASTLVPDLSEILSRAEDSNTLSSNVSSFACTETTADAHPERSSGMLPPKPHDGGARVSGTQLESTAGPLRTPRNERIGQPYVILDKKAGGSLSVPTKARRLFDNE